MARSIPELSLDAQELHRKLITVSIGEIALYAELSALIRADVTKKARGYLNTARYIAQRENRMVFAAVRGVGLKRLDDSGIIRAGQDYVGRIHRTARRGVKQTVCANYEKLSREDQVKSNSTLSMLGTLHEVTKNTVLKRLEVKVLEKQKQLPLAETLEIFK